MCGINFMVFGFLFICIEGAEGIHQFFVVTVAIANLVSACIQILTYERVMKGQAKRLEQNATHYT